MLSVELSFCSSVRQLNQGRKYLCANLDVRTVTMKLTLFT